MGLMGVSHITEGEGRWYSSNNKGEATTAAYCTILLFIYCSGTATLSFHYHYSLSIMALRLIFKSSDMWSRCGGEMQGTFGWLNMFVCKTGRQKSAMFWWIAVTSTVSPLWPPPAVCPVMSPDTTVALWKTLAHYPSLSLPAVFLTSSAWCHTSIPQPSSTYHHLTVTISIALLSPPSLKMTKGTLLHHHHFP